MGDIKTKVTLASKEQFEELKQDFGQFIKWLHLNSRRYSLQSMKNQFTKESRFEEAVAVRDEEMGIAEQVAAIEKEMIKKYIVD